MYFYLLKIIKDLLLLIFITGPFKGNKNGIFVNCIFFFHFSKNLLCIKSAVIYTGNKQSELVTKFVADKL